MRPSILYCETLPSAGLSRPRHYCRLSRYKDGQPGIARPAWASFRAKGCFRYAPPAIHGCTGLSIPCAWLDSLVTCEIRTFLAEVVAVPTAVPPHYSGLPGRGIRRTFCLRVTMAGDSGS